MGLVNGIASKQEQILKDALSNNIPPNINSVDILIYLGSTLKKKLVDCNSISFVGRQTKGNKKADIKIKNSSNEFLISLKNKPFKSWQSADTLSGDDIDSIIDEIMRSGKVKNSILVHPDYNFALKYIKPLFKITDMNGKEKTLVVDINQKSKEKVVFGSDILGNGAVIQIDGKRKDLVLFSNNNLIINVEKYIDNISQLKSLDIVYKVTNYYKSRNAKRYPGIRVEAIPSSEMGTSIIGKYKNINIVV